MLFNYSRGIGLKYVLIYYDYVVLKGQRVLQYSREPVVDLDSHYPASQPGKLFSQYTQARPDFYNYIISVNFRSRRDKFECFLVNEKMLA